MFVVGTHPIRTRTSRHLPTVFTDDQFPLPQIRCKRPIPLQLFRPRDLAHRVTWIGDDRLHPWHRGLRLGQNDIWEPKGFTLGPIET